MHCHCEACSDAPRDTYTEAHRHACEARWLSRQSPGFRADYLARIAYRRGLDAAVRLRATLATLPPPHRR